MTHISKKNKGQYFTTSVLLKETIYILILNNPSVILEPSVGQGHLVEYIKAKKPNINFDLYEDGAQWNNLSNVGQHPNGISPYGLYDVIGNVPELVIYNNNLYVLGTVHSSGYETVSSFCTDSAFGEDEHQAMPASDDYEGQKYYGVRLIRTISE